MAKAVQYPCAHDESNNLVFALDMNPEHRHDHTYHCPNCGHPMLPKLGEHNAWHFAHSENHKCGIESYIHLVAKEILVKRFNERKKPFMIGFKAEQHCFKAEKCKEINENCERLGLKYGAFDLLDFYDLPAECEIDLLAPDGVTHLRPDVLLRSSNKARKEIFLEVFYKHRSSKEKIISGCQIIEIHIRTIDDLRKLGTIKCFQENEDIRFYNFKSRPVTPEQIVSEIRKVAAENDHQIIESYLPGCKQSAEYKRRVYHLQRFILYESGKTFQTEIYENELNEHKFSALMDITFDTDKIGNRCFDPKMISVQKFPKFKNCSYCGHCTSNDFTMWCDLGKNGTRWKETFNQDKGKWCSFFSWREPMFSEKDPVKEGDDYFIWISPKQF